MEISTPSRNARIIKDEGWITIEREERGSRRILRLTSAGLQKLREASRAWDRAQTEAREPLGDEGARELKQLGDGVCDDQLRHVRQPKRA
jgi:DNA-binding PadR family transcriptional regulator